MRPSSASTWANHNSLEHSHHSLRGGPWSLVHTALRRTNLPHLTIFNLTRPKLAEDMRQH